MTERLKILISPLFILFLTLLITNDFFLKVEFHNAITGKLSDFSGLFIFPIFWSVIFPQRKLLVFISTAVLFTFWKSEYSEGLIEFLTRHFNIGRTVDLSDLIALPMLLFAWFYMENNSMRWSNPTLMVRLTACFIGIVTVFSFCATSQLRYIQSFDQPQYVLLKDPTLQEFHSYDEFEFYKRDSFLVVKINYLNIGEPVESDDYNKNQSIKNLDQDILRLIGDSASLVPLEKITLLTIDTERSVDSLRFNGGRLDGRFTRTKGGKRIMEGFYKMGLEDSTWTIRDTIGNHKVVKTFVNGEANHIQYFSDDKLKSSSRINTRSDTIFNTYMKLATLILCMVGICYLLHKNHRNTAQGHFELKLGWKLLLCFLAPFLIWLFYIGIMLLFVNDGLDTFTVIATLFFIFIIFLPLMFVVVFLIKLGKEIDIFLYLLLFALACSALAIYIRLEALSN